jgi:hypothetical protein
MLPNKFGFVALSLASLLAFSLVACKEEKVESVSDVHDNTPRIHDAGENADRADNNENGGKSDAVVSKGCALNWDYDSLHYSEHASGGVIGQGNLVPNTKSGNPDCHMQQAEIRYNDSEIEMDTRKTGVSETTTELRIHKNEFSLKEEDEYGQFGGEWPDNEFSREFLRWLPKPEMPFESLAFKMNKHFGIIFKEMALDKMKGYAEQVKASGYTIGAQTKDKPDLSLFVYKARNSEGYAVKITCVGNCVLGLDVPRN